MGRLKTDEDGTPYVDGRWLTTVYEKNGVVLTKTQPEDPAYALLLDDFTSTPNKEIFNDKCYICLDPEFAQMGLPLCYPCAACGGHVAADDTICDACEADQQELHHKACEAECEQNGHQWQHHAATSHHASIVIDSTGVHQSEEMVHYPAYTSCDHCGQQKDDDG